MKELKTIPTSRHGPADDSKGCCTPSLPLPRDNFLISQEVISHLLHWRHQIPFFPHSGCPFWSKAAGFPSPPHPGQNSTTISNFQASPPSPFAAVPFQKEPKFCLVEMTVISRTLYTLFPRHLEFSAPVVSVASLISLLGHVY